MLDSFIPVAGAHFLALLSPGPDFILIARSALVSGWRTAAAVCVGVALGNGVFIALAVGGFALLDPDGPLFRVVQWAGAAWLFYLGIRFWRAASRAPAGDAGTAATLHGRAGFLAGLGSALLNPKNGLFYMGLFSLLAARATPTGVQALYGLWMFLVVLLWDLLVARLLVARGRAPGLARHGPWVERAAGLLLIALAFGVVLA
ncbi:LysE family translocator [Alloalcanivorax gelatiniphagus]|uniref:LysE family translocator n=1 Tax=Alloalcanivorax gelatiniphagus TaxID=1194167 RepID=A0ABY2XFN2_9GAMM|nr:LysE family translocator [Alloalcanivorax gelatiniphagus]TMW10398.1 LysE family translocator [Alloalcanivorax gelatiniphagus]|tara:strand:- start:38215 stop:38823 length:609 start_codon:yes stop_codon:yes gene_type:complete